MTEANWLHRSASTKTTTTTFTTPVRTLTPDARARRRTPCLVYDGTSRIQLDDRVLAHLDTIIVSKFRRREGFALRWRDSSATGDGHSMI